MRNRDFREDIESREDAITKERNRTMALITEEERKVDVPLLLMNKPEVDPVVLQKYDDADVEVDYEEKSDDGFDSSSEEESDEDEDDEEKQLQAELQRLREERAAAQAKKVQEEEEEQERLSRDSALRGNPLLNNSGFDDSAKIKRRWNDDVVFRNQAKDEPQTKKRFINDTIRNDFHRSFLKKFVQ